MTAQTATIAPLAAETSPQQQGGHSVKTVVVVSATAPAVAVFVNNRRGTAQLSVVKRDSATSPQ
jgi:hypothetical protein